MCRRDLSGLRELRLSCGSGVSGREACTKGLVGALYVKVDARDAFEIARNLPVRAGGMSGDERNGREACRRAADGNAECHGATGDVDSDGTGSSLVASPNLSNADVDCSLSLKSPRCRADLGLSICSPTAWLSCARISGDSESESADRAASSSGEGDFRFLSEERDAGRSSSGDVGRESRLFILLMSSCLSIDVFLLLFAGVLGRPV